MFGLVGTLTSKGAGLTARPGRRLAWAALVTVLGAVGAVPTSVVLSALHGPANSVLAIVGLSSPFLVIAGALTANWPIRITAITLLGVLLGLGIWLPGAAAPFSAFWRSLFSA